MDIQAYITSGKLELFLLGELSERERAEVVSMAAQYPEIQQELDELEQAMFDIDHKIGVAPSAGIKAKIFDSLDSEFKEETKPISNTAPAQGKVVPLSPWKSFAVAASLVAVLASSVAIFYASKFYEKEQQFTALLQEQSVMADNLNQVKLEFEAKDSQLDKLVAGDFRLVKLKGESLNMQKDASVNLFWDQGAQEVFVAVNNLNELSDEYDYQLWAIGDQGPIGIGLVNEGEKMTLQQMQAVAQAGAFAITIEPKGGSESPTLEKLVVIGNVA
ncbi:anti-sigma factor [Algoriphagus marinus]|uniref:anti-sigma factor n=1 Tax=Algoriphagus marinus TaxID=1925762 RepID=UPI00094BAD2A|nr:anti-sigma factor [Algoriphagus marinus]